MQQTTTTTKLAYRPLLTQKPLLQAHTEVQRACAGKQILSSVLQVWIVVPHTLGSVTLGEHLQNRVPLLQKTFRAKFRLGVRQSEVLEGL